MHASKSGLLALVLGLCMVSSAAAHFIWIEVEGSEARVYFSEGPYADAARLAEKIKHAELLALAAGGEAQPLAAALKTEDELGYLVAPLKGAPASLAVRCQYGVYKKHLLHYFAQHAVLAADGEQALGQPEKALKLAIVPARNEGRLQLRVLWEGQPLADAPVFIEDAASKSHELKTAADGRVELAAAMHGTYHIRTSRIVANAPGELAGQPYEDEMYQTTLVLKLADKKNAAAEDGSAAAEKVTSDSAAAAPTTAVNAKTPADPAATELLTKARASRAVWHNFPGFSADLAVNLDGAVSQGKLTVSPAGTVTIELLDEAARKWAQRQLNSLVNHRLPGSDFANEASFEDQEERHPLGRKLRLAEDSMGSVYRIRDNVVAQVNRDSDEQKFTISVLDVERNPEGYYLPTVFTVSFWNAETGQLAFSQTHKHTWRRVGAFDLPEELLEIHAAAKAYHARSIQLSRLELLPSKN